MKTQKVTAAMMRKKRKLESNVGIKPMQINIKKMEAQGFEVDMISNDGIINIYPQDGFRLDWQPMTDQFNRTNLSERDMGEAIEKFQDIIQEIQIVTAIRNCQ